MSESAISLIRAIRTTDGLSVGVGENEPVVRQFAATLQAGAGCGPIRASSRSDTHQGAEPVTVHLSPWGRVTAETGPTRLNLGCDGAAPPLCG